LRFDLALDRFSSVDNKLGSIGRGHTHKLPRSWGKGNPLEVIFLGFSLWVSYLQ